MDTQTEVASSYWRKFFSMFGIVASFAVAAVLIYGALLARWTDNTFDKSGPFGDSFAPLNTLFAGLAFAALWASLRMQRQELALQREELRLTRQELSQSVAAQARLALAAEQDEALRTRPRVVVTLEYSRSSLFLVVRNHGTTTARKVRLSVDKPVEIYRLREDQQTAHLTDLSIFSARGHTLAPDFHMSFMLRRNNDGGWPTLAFEVTAEYCDAGGKSFCEIYSLDSELILGSSLQRDSLTLLVDEVKRLNDNLVSIKKEVANVAKRGKL